MVEIILGKIIGLLMIIKVKNIIANLTG